ncbi:MAG: hypothetical protein N3D74_00645 [Caldisericia bacterium]|nr:hypothetical protein [Caldisericia bacterium]
MKKIIVFLFIISIFSLPSFKFLNSQDLNNIEFQLIKDEEYKIINVGKGDFREFTFNFLKKDDLYELRIKGRGNLYFKIIFKNMLKIFPKKEGIFISPLYILKNKEGKYFVYLIDSNDLHYFEANSNEEYFEIKYNFYIIRKESIKFRIREVDSIVDAFNIYYFLYRLKERKTSIDGLILPNISLTTIINNIGIENLKIGARIIDPQEQYAPERILEGTKYKFKNFIILDPIKLKFENISSKNIQQELYFNENPYYKLMGIQILTSSIKNKDGSLVKIEKKSEPTYKIVSGEKVPDYKENSIDTIIFLNPEVDYLKNKGISSFEIFYSRYIYPLNISITILNRQLEIKGENEAKYSGIALDFSYVNDFFNFDKNHFNKNPKSYLDGKIAQFYASNLFNFLIDLEKKTTILSINPKYFQLIMNSDILYKEIDDLNYLNDLPLERVLVPNRPIFFAYKLKNEDINEKILNKIFKYSLIYGIFPTFSKHQDEPFSIWDNVEKLRLLINYKNYFDIIGKIESKDFKVSNIATIENGEIYQFGDFPDFYLTINGYGKIKLEKSIFKSNENISILNPLNNKKIEFYEEDGKLIIDSWGLDVINIKSEINEVINENEKLSKITKFDNRNISLLLILIIIFFTILNIILRKINIYIKIKPFIIISILFFLLITLNYFLGISSPFFILLSIGIYFLFTSLFSFSYKRIFLLNFSLVFIISSLIFYLLNGNLIIFSPPYYLFNNTYFISIIISLLIFIFYHFDWKKIYDLIIFLSILTIILLSNPTKNPFYSPPIDYTFLISSLILTFFILLLSKNLIKFILSLALITFNFLYVFVDKIYYILLSNNIFLSVDLIQNLILIFIISLLTLYFSKVPFKNRPKIIHNSLILFFIIISIYLNRIMLTSPHIFGIISSIIKLILYIILIIYIIFFFESTFQKKEE